MFVRLANIGDKFYNTYHSLNQQYRLRLLESLKENGDRLLSIGSFEMLKNLRRELLEKQGKWTSPHGAEKRFKNADDRLEIKWHGAKKQSLTCGGEKGQLMKDKLIALKINFNLSLTLPDITHPHTCNKNLSFALSN